MAWEEALRVTPGEGNSSQRQQSAIGIISQGSDEFPDSGHF